MATEAIVQSIKKYLHRLQEQGIPISFGVLYGSYARGDACDESDIDLIVVSPRFDQNPTWHDTEILWETTVSTDNRIEPVGVGNKRWIEEDGSPLIEIARQEGEIISLDE